MEYPTGYMDLTAFTWQLPVAVGLIYLMAWFTDLAIYLLDRVGLGSVLTRWSRGLLKGTGDPQVDTLRAGGYSLRAARRMSGGDSRLPPRSR